jgi:hypothetical protein
MVQLEFVPRPNQSPRGAIQTQGARHSPTAVCTGADHCRPVRTPAACRAPVQPLIFGTIHLPRERAILLVQALIEHGLQGKSIYVGDLEIMHERVCKERGWAPASWLAICRELKSIGLRKWTGYGGSDRLTLYEIQPPRANVVDLAAVERRQA